MFYFLQCQQISKVLRRRPCQMSAFIQEAAALLTPAGASSSATICTRGKSTSMATSVRGNSYKKCAISPNGFLAALVAKRSFVVELILVRLDPGWSVESKYIDCHKMCPTFKGDISHTDVYDCKFSLDSSCIAVGSSFGDLFLVDAELNYLCTICPGIIDKALDRMSNERCFDFDSRFARRQLAVGSGANFVYVCDIESAIIVGKKQVCDEGTIQCLKYSKRGHCLAVALSHGDIHILEPDDLSCLYTLSAASLNRSMALCTVNGSLAKTISMSFSTAGEQLAVSYTDGFIRIWQLQPIINLQHMCRMTILQLVRLHEIYLLPLPKKIISELYLVISRS